MNGDTALQPDSQPISGIRDRVLSGLALLTLAFAGILVYSNSFNGIFILDGERLVNNERIHKLWPITDVIRGVPRPVVEYSLAINYHFGKYEVWGYHAFNIGVHILAAWTLFGLVRRTLRLPAIRQNVKWSAEGVAFAAALLWLVHPLQTQSVDYLVQRGESMMGLFYLLTLYCTVRSGGETKQSVGITSRLWQLGAVLACAMAMGCKEVAVTIPVVVFLYNRIFLSDSFAEMVRRRGLMYAGLAATWAIPLVLGYVPRLFNADETKSISVGFGYQGTTWLAYLLTQPGVILQYLRLCVWPRDLCLDYWWSMAKGIADAALPGIIVLAMIAATGWLLYVRPKLGFVAACFFIILAPTSSFVPIADAAFEHRMYLPLASVVLLAVIGVRKTLDRIESRGYLSRLVARRVTIVMTALAAALLGYRTYLRNPDYNSQESMWRDVVRQRPDNPRALGALGKALLKEKRFDEALTYLQDATRFLGDLAKTHPNQANNILNDLGTVFFRNDRFAEAANYYRKALVFYPKNAMTHNNLAMALDRAGHTDEAIAHFRRALEINPDYTDAHHELSLALRKKGMTQEAEEHAAQALAGSGRTDSLHIIYTNQANTLADKGNLDEAMALYRKALALKPDYAKAHTNLAVALEEKGALPEALKHHQEAVRLEPVNALARCNLGLVLARLDRMDEAVAELQEAARLDPQYGRAQKELGVAYFRLGRPDETIAAFQRAAPLLPTDAELRYNLGALLAQRGRTKEARSALKAALQIDPKNTDAQRLLNQLAP